MRTFLGVGKCAPLPMLYGDMAWIPSNVRQKTAMIRYWIRLTRTPATRLARRVFDWDHGRAKRGTWRHDMKQIFEKCDLIDAYNDKSDDLGLVNRIKNRLHQDDINQRRNDMMNMSRMKTYRVLNATPLFIDTGPAPHLRVALTREQRSVLSKLRSGTLPLAIETGRTDRHHCHSACDAQVVENEEHFLFNCPQYHQLRQTICEGLLADNVEIKSLFDSDTAIKKLTRYIFDSLKLRNHWMINSSLF